MTKKLHGQTLGSPNRRHGAGVGYSAEVHVPRSKIIFGGFAPGSEKVAMPPPSLGEINNPYHAQRPDIPQSPHSPLEATFPSFGDQSSFEQIEEKAKEAIPVAPTSMPDSSNSSNDSDNGNNGNNHIQSSVRFSNSVQTSKHNQNYLSALNAAGSNSKILEAIVGKKKKKKKIKVTVKNGGRVVGKGE